MYGAVADELEVFHVILRPSAVLHCRCWLLVLVRLLAEQCCHACTQSFATASIRHDAPTTSVASQGRSVSLHHGFCRVESPTWCELKFTLSGPHVCAIARCVRQRVFRVRHLHWRRRERGVRQPGMGADLRDAGSSSIMLYVVHLGFN